MTFVDSDVYLADHSSEGSRRHSAAALASKQSTATTDSNDAEGAPVYSPATSDGGCISLDEWAWRMLHHNEGLFAEGRVPSSLSPDTREQLDESAKGIVFGLMPQLSEESRRVVVACSEAVLWARRHKRLMSACGVESICIALARRDGRIEASAESSRSLKKTSRSQRNVFTAVILAAESASQEEEAAAAGPDADHDDARTSRIAPSGSSGSLAARGTPKFL